MLRTDEKVYIANTLAEMNYLVKYGYPVIKVRDDPNNPKYKVFYFKWSEEIEYLGYKFKEKRNIIKRS